MWGEDRDSEGLVCSKKPISSVPHTPSEAALLVPPLLCSWLPQPACSEIHRRKPLRCCFPPSSPLELLCVQNLLWPHFFPPPTEPSCLSHCADVQKRRGTFTFMQSFTECAERCNLFLGELFSFACPRAFLHPLLSVH